MYTRKDLTRLHELYERNWDMIVLTVGTPSHRHYLKRERKLEALCIKIQKYLGIRVENPCKLNTRKDCAVCTGYLARPNTRAIKKRGKIYQYHYWSDVEMEYCEEICPYKLFR